MPRRQTAAQNLPRNVALLGQVGEVCIYDRSRRSEASGGYYSLSVGEGRKTRILCSDEQGRELFILRPQTDADGPVKVRSRALHCLELYERFMHRSGNEFFNLIVPPFRTPVWCGELAVLHYFADKAIPVEGEEELEDDAPPPVAEWVHWFESDFGPAWPRIYDVGHGQYWIPRGPFHVTDEGIDYFGPEG